MKLVFSELPTGNIMQNTEDYFSSKSKLYLNHSNYLSQEFNRKNFTAYADELAILAQLKFE